MVAVRGPGGKDGEEARGCGGVGWGTWEELVLGSAVLRHGGAARGVAWGAVAAELRSRSPCSFSPEVRPPSNPSLVFTTRACNVSRMWVRAWVVGAWNGYPLEKLECEAKFSEIQARYSTCDAWFDELRKQRVAELKRELQKSESLIGSLQSMIESLSNRKHDDGNSECHTSHIESCSHTENTAETNSSSKELSKDRSSAASFTEEASNSQKSQQVQHCDTDLIQVNNTSAEALLKPQVEKVCTKDSLLWGSRKKRGLRDRRIVLMADDSSRDGETTSTSCIQREGSSEGCMKKGLKVLTVESGVSVHERAKPNLVEILKTISTQGDCLMLQRQLDTQRKRVRYKKMIHQHMDFRILHSKIKSGAISSTKELLRDMLVFVNNVLAFYPKATLQHVAAIELRDLVCKTVQQSSSSLSKSCGATGTASAPVVKKNARTLQPGVDGPRDAKRSKVSSRVAGSTVKQGEVKDAPPTANVKTIRKSAPAKKRGVGRPPKSGQKRAGVQQDSPNKGRKSRR